MAKKEERKKTAKPKQETRPPVVVVLGHIDHGKTTLLDYIRKARVAAGEAGGITQGIGAYQVEVKGKKGEVRKITFIDTPGHAAFSKMRERGARVADVAVLVVAGDDGVKPQTVEAIAHAKAAGIPLVVAINKMDVAPAQAATKVKGQLAKEGVATEGQGGDTPVVSVSAKTGKGVEELLEMITLVSELAELKSDPTSTLKAVVIESRLSPRQGSLATLIVQDGTLRVRDEVFAGEVKAKVKALVDETGKRVKEAGPGTPVQVLGFGDVASVGAIVGESPAAKAEPEEEEHGAGEGEEDRLNLILKADTQGALEALERAIEQLEVEGKHANLLLKGVGPIGDSDVRLASTSDGLILGFNIVPTAAADRLARDLGVGVRSFTVIYEMLEVVEKLLAGARAIEEKERAPQAEVLKVFELLSGDHVAGVKILNGKFKYKDRVRVLRDEEESYKGRIRGLRIGKDDVPEVSSNQEAGILVKPDFEFKKGDILVLNS
ncbi:GTP-binding protein [Candidatus Saccharibacteria bacterium]|nr:GTP-binding protein [Candidatus Saccharibacteria bacterium]